MTDHPIARKLGALRAVIALLASSAIVLSALAVAVVLAIWIAFASLPAGCGFNSSDVCTNPDANNTSAVVGIGIAASVVGGAAIWLVTAAIGGVLGAARHAVRRRVVVGFAAGLVAVLGLGPVAMPFAPSAVRLVLAIALACAVLCTVQRAAVEHRRS
jgi:hypothetical protein